MVVNDVAAWRASFCAKGVRAARRAMEMIRRNAGDPSAQARNCYYLWQALNVCYDYAQAWQTVVECALEAHQEMLLTGRWAQWMDYLNMAIQASRRLADRRAETTLLLYLGRMQERCGEWNPARRHLEEAIALADGLGDRSARARALATLSDIERQAGHLDEAQRLAQQAIESLQGVDDAQALSEAYRGLGNVHFQRGRSKEAVAAYHTALEYAHACGDLHCLARIYHNLGTVCAQQGNTRSAAVEYDRALELFRQVGDMAGEALALSNIGLACQADRGYWRQAAETFRSAIAIAQKIGYYQGETTALSYLIDTLLKMGEVEQAEAAIEQLRAIYRRTDNTYGLAAIEHQTARVCLARNDARAALLHLQHARESPELSADCEDMALVETETGRAWAALGEWEKAESACKRALDLWAVASEWPGELDTWLALVELYRQTAAWEKLAGVLEAARALAAQVEREDALAVLDAAAGDALFAAGQIAAGCAAYLTALQRISASGENDRQAQCYQRLVAQARAQMAAQEQAGRPIEGRLAELAALIRAKQDRLATCPT